VSLTLFIATRVSIRTSDTSTGPRGSGFVSVQNAPLPLALLQALSFGAWLKPRYIFRAGTLN
jgi:hypothetical protein